jgi:hypothetical protein
MHDHYYAGGMATASYSAGTDMGNRMDLINAFIKQQSIFFRISAGSDRNADTTAESG